MLHELGGPRSDEHRQVPQAGRVRLLEQPQPALDVVGQQRRAAWAERRRDGTLPARFDIELREREPRALLGQRARRRRQPLALREGPFDRGEPLASRPQLLVVDGRQPQWFRPQTLDERLGCLPA